MPPIPEAAFRLAAQTKEARSWTTYIWYKNANVSREPSNTPRSGGRSLKPGSVTAAGAAGDSGCYGADGGCENSWHDDGAPSWAPWLHSAALNRGV